MYFLKTKNDISHGINSIGLYIEQIWFSSFTISADEKKQKQNSFVIKPSECIFSPSNEKISRPNQKKAMTRRFISVYISLLHVGSCVC